MRLRAMVALSLLASHAGASLITFDPNDYAEGTRLNDAVDEVAVSTLQGGDVFSSPVIDESQQTPSGFIDAGPIGDHVLSTSATTNDEWMASELQFFDSEFETLSALQTYHAGFLLFEFAQPTDFISLLSLELFPDAGWGGGSDPQRFFFYDADGNLIDWRMEGPSNPLPAEDAPSLPDESSPYAYFYNEFSMDGVKYLAASGESEPTSFGRLQFRTEGASQIPEPSTLILSVLGLLGLGLCRRFGPARMQLDDSYSS